MNAFDSAGDAEIILYGALDLPPVVTATNVGHLEEKPVLPHLQHVVHEPLVLVGKRRRVGVDLAGEARPFALAHHIAAAAGPGGQHGNRGRVLDVEADSGGTGLAGQIPRLAPEGLVVEELRRREGNGGDGVVNGDRPAARIRHVGHARVVTRFVDEASVGTFPTHLK